MKMSRLFLVLLLPLFLIGCTSEDAPTKNVSPDQGDMEETTALEQGTRPVTAEKLNLNTASKEEFMTIPGVGERMAHEFDEYRPYQSILQFRREMAKYVDDEIIVGYEEHVYVPIDINESDVATVGQILGVDEAAAEAIVAKRPFADQQAFFAAVTEAAGGVASQFSRLYLADEE